MAKKVLPKPVVPTKKEVQLSKEDALLVENFILKQQLITTSIQSLQRDHQEVSGNLSRLLLSSAENGGGEYVNRSFNTDKGTIMIIVPTPTTKKKT